MTVESIVLSMAGGLLGLAFGCAGSRALVHFAGDAVNFGQMAGVTLDVRVIAFTLGLAFLTAIAFGLIPALHATGIDLQSNVKLQARGSTGAPGQNRSRSALVVVEVALSTMLVVGAGLLLRTFINLTDVKLGIRPEHVVTMRTLVMGSPSVRATMVEAILKRVETLPGVIAVGTIQFLPLAGFTNHGPFQFVGRPLPADRTAMEADVSTISRGYCTAIGMEVLRGRPFGRQDAMESPRVALVNQSFVNRYSRSEEPIGRVIVGDWSNPKPTAIIGVVNDIRHNGLTMDPRPTIFLAQSQVPGYFTNLVVRTGSGQTAIASTIRQEIRKVEPRQPFTDIRPMQQYVSMALARPRLYANFVSIFALLALFLAATGIYGLLAYAVSRRTHEIGVRMALGARPKDVLTSTVWQGVRLVAAGVALGTAAAMAGGRILAKYLFGVHPSDPLTYAGVLVVFALVALSATYIPARRAASIDPVVALRYE